MFYINFMVTTKQKPIVNAQKRKNLSKPQQKIINPQRKRSREEENKGMTKQPDNN